MELNKTKDSVNLTIEDFKDLPNKSKKRLNAEILLTSEFLDSDVEKPIMFTFNSVLDETDSPDVMRRELTIARDAFLAGPAIKAISVNMTSKVTNSIRNDVFQEEEVLDDIESFVFTNPNPKSLICQNLTGRVFSKEEFATTPFLPPLHHNCKSFIVAQTEGKKSNKILDPNGLQIVGTANERAKILKSKTL